MRFDYAVVVDGADITELLRDRLLQLRVVDEAGLESDELSLTIDNRGDVVPPPSKGNVVTAALGIDAGPLVHMGKYVITEVRSDGGSGGRTMTVTATAADLQKSLKAKKTRPWTDTTIGEVVTQIAGEHGLRPRIADTHAGVELGRVPYRQIDQADESDLHFLRRLALMYDAVCKPVDGELVFAPAGELRGTVASADGGTHAVSLSEGDVSSWTATAPDRGRFASASASYIDPETRERVSVVAGDGSPTFAVTELSSDAATALAAAQSELDALTRGNATLSVSTVGNPYLRAEALLSFETSDVLARGDWSIVKAEHVLGKSGYRCEIDAEQPKGAK